MLKRYINTEYTSYEDFKHNFRINVPPNFNFAYDIVDAWAEQSPDKLALVWCDDKGRKARFTFGELKRMSDKAANFFMSIGIKKGDPVMLILKRRYEFWFSILALHKIGAICIPATHLLKTKDVTYRNNAADIKMIVSVGDDAIVDCIDQAQADSPTLIHKVMVGGKRDGWISYDEGIASAPDTFERPAGDAGTANDDIMLLYFTSGTTGYPKMVRHNFTYPLGHILTASYWQCVREDKLHLTLSDTGWAKSAWGKIYGQWIAGAVVFVYDYDRFVPKDIMGILEEYQISTFCAPPTVFRYLIKEDLSRYDLSHLEYCVVAGEPLNPEVYQQFLHATGIKLMEGYGQTELVVTVATYPWLVPKPGSMGKPSPGYDVDIVDENGIPARSERWGRSSSAPIGGASQWGCSTGITGTTKGPGASGTAASTTPETPHGGMRTGITGLWAAPTTSSSPPGTGSGPSRWRALYWSIPPCWNAPSPGCPTRCGGPW